MKKLELVQAFKMEQENPHIAAYKRVFPGARPSIFQLDMIEGMVTDARAWEQAVTFWAANDYRPQSIGKIIEYYNQSVNGTVQRFEDKTKVQMRVGRHTEPEETHKCGKCFDTGEALLEWLSPTEAKWGECPNGCRRAA